MAAELASGCFEVKSAPPFAQSGHEELDAQKIQTLAVKQPCRKECFIVTV